MALVRRVDAEAIALQRQGELGLWPSLPGPGGRADRCRATPCDRRTTRSPPTASTASRSPAGSTRCACWRCSAGSTPARGTSSSTTTYMYSIIIGTQGRAGHRLRDGPRAGRAGRQRRPGAGRGGRLLLRRRRQQPGRPERGPDLRVLVQRARRVLLLEQPVGDLRAQRAPVPSPALPAGGRLRLPRGPGRRERRARRARRDDGGAGPGPVGQRARRSSRPTPTGWARTPPPTTRPSTGWPTSSSTGARATR